METAEARTLSSTVGSFGLRSFHVDASSIATDTQLFGALAHALEFPEYFGHNWNALNDCLSDLAWCPAEGYVLFLGSAEVFWQRSPRVAAELVRSWLFAAERWQDERTPFHLVFVW